MKVSRKKMQCEVPSVAMGDIAFNLLIFFVILAKARDDAHLRWEPATAPKVEKSGNPIASVVIDTEGQLYLDGGHVGESTLRTALAKQLSEVPPGKRVVLLKFDKDTLAGKFQPVIEAVSEAGGELVHVLQEKKE